ncbi:hypothetical protein Xen7305DRAFT_00039230, partial [Xenococcus sp. PCC 7305]
MRISFSYFQSKIGGLTILLIESYVCLGY